MIRSKENIETPKDQVASVPNLFTTDVIVQLYSKPNSDKAEGWLAATKVARKSVVREKSIV